MGVRAIVVNKKKQRNMRVYFRLRDQRRLDATLLFKADHHFNPPRHPSPLGWFPQKDAAFLPYRWLQTAGTNDFVNERYFFYENIQFKHFCVERM